MITLLHYRAALISVLFGLFGSALSKLLVIDEMTWYYTAIASLIGFVVNLLVSFLLKGRWSKNMKNYTKIVCILFFFGLITMVYLHTKYYIEGTFPYSDYEDKVTYYVKGTVYTPTAIKFKQENPHIISDGDLIREGFESPFFKGKVWTEESINQNKLKLITSYSLIVIFFVSIISILIEVLMVHYNKATTKTLEPVAGQ